MRGIAAAEERGDEAQLLARAASGSRAAFANLVEQHYPTAYRVAWRMIAGLADCEDIVQEVFLTLWDGRAKLQQLTAFRPYLLRAVSNRVIDRSRLKPLTPIDEIAEPAAPKDRGHTRQGIANEVDRAIASLPERQAQALILVYYESMSNIAAAEVMELSVEALESLLARAKRGLKLRLGHQRDDLLDDLERLDD